MRRLLLATTTLATAFGTIAFGTVALAADMPPVYKAKPVAYVNVTNWEGVYIGAFAGGHWSKDRWTSDETAPPAGTLGALDLDIKGFTGGLVSGANLQHGNFVWGVETDLGFLTGRETLGPLRAQFPLNASIDFVETQLRYNAHARLRFGWSMGSWMPFVAAGGVYANTRNTHTDNGNAGGALPVTQTLTRDRVGYTIGAGVDWMVNQNWIVRAEYLHDRYLMNAFGSAVDFDSEYYQLKSNTVRGALLYKFGADAYPAPGGYTKAPPRARPGGEWAGVYLGAFVGAHKSKDEWTSDETGPANGLGGPQDIDLNGFTAGGIIGANVQYGRHVWGVELDAGAMTGNETFGNLRQQFPGVASTDSIDTHMRWNAHARIRSGYSFGSWMPFLATGLAYANTRMTMSDAGNAGGALPTSSSTSLNRVGFTTGGGVDWMFAPNWIARAEYLYDRFAASTFAVPTESDSQHMALRSHIGRLAVMYKFGDDGVPAYSGGITKGPPMAYAAPWTGGYIGVYAGGHWSKDRWSSDETEPVDFVTGPLDLKVDGVVAGGLIGANKQYGRAVFSLETDGGWMGGRDSLNVLDTPGTDLTSLETETRWNAHARMRFGWSMGSWMPFVAAGGAYADTRVTRVGLPAASITESRQLNRVGMTFGGGVDWMVNQNWIVRAEYLHDRFATATATVPNSGDSQHLELTSNIVRGALIYKFGAPVVAKY